MCGFLFFSMHALYLKERPTYTKRRLPGDFGTCTDSAATGVEVQRLAPLAAVVGRGDRLTRRGSWPATRRSGRRWGPRSPGGSRSTGSAHNAAPERTPGAAAAPESTTRRGRRSINKHTHTPSVKALFGTSCITKARAHTYLVKGVGLGGQKVRRGGAKFLIRLPDILVHQSHLRMGHFGSCFIDDMVAFARSQEISHLEHQRLEG